MAYISLLFPVIVKLLYPEKSRLSKAKYPRQNLPAGGTSPEAEKFFNPPLTFHLLEGV